MDHRINKQRSFTPLRFTSLQFHLFHTITARTKSQLSPYFSVKNNLQSQSTADHRVLTLRLKSPVNLQLSSEPFSVQPTSFRPSPLFHNRAPSASAPRRPMGTSNGYSSNHRYSSSLAASSQRDVTYSCGSCGYDLNLNSSSRNTSTIGSKYGKSIKKGIISFFSIDESRFNQVEEFTCGTFFLSKCSWGLFRRKTKLLCRNCGNRIGIAHDLKDASSYHLITNGLTSPSANEVSSKRKYDIRIRSLQPSSAGFSTPLAL